MSAPEAGVGEEPRPEMRLTERPDLTRVWLRDMWRYRDVLAALARADFHVRYKRAAFGIAWAVVVPLVQSTVLAVVFSRVIKVGGGSDFGAYVLSGILPWTFFSQTLGSSATSIVEGSGLTDKVWFPRAILVMVPTLANLRGFAVSLAALVVALPLLGAGIGWSLLLMPLAFALLLGFAVSLALILAALHVYFRDVKFLVQAGLLVWFYITPIAYPKSLLGSLSGAVDFNPLTGVVDLFHLAALGDAYHWQRSVTVSVVTTVVLAIAAVAVHRRHDRLFVDLL